MYLDKCLSVMWRQRSSNSRICAVSEHQSRKRRTAFFTTTLMFSCAVRIAEVNLGKLRYLKGLLHTLVKAMAVSTWEGVAFIVAFTS
eukprot:4789090-Pleurochrysis_carterae.AAC.3